MPFLCLIDWISEGIIGQGNYGEVELIREKNTGINLAAMKKIKYPIHGPKGAGEESEEARKLKHEIEILGQLHHENIASYKHVTIYDDCFCLVMEYMSMGSLKKKLRENGGFSEEETLCFAYQILKGLDYLHSREETIVHGDLKCANILMADEKHVKLCDFGMARSLQRLASPLGTNAGQITATFHFLSPEEVAATEFTVGPKSDIWSFGCTVVEMLTTRPPWWEDTCDKMAKMIKFMTYNTEPTYILPENVSNATQRCLTEYCFQYDPSRRKSANYLLDHFGKC